MPHLNISLQRDIHWGWWFLLAAAFILGLGVRTYLLFAHSITPDEPWHLADAVFTTQHGVPLVDFESRQPVYIFLMAAFLKIFGSSYLIGRLLMLLTVLGIVILMFLLARCWFGTSVAITATVCYLLFPFVAIFEPLIQEQTLTVLFTTASVYFASAAVLRKHDRQSALFLFWAGILGALAYYSRQTGLATILIAIGLIGFRNAVTTRRFWMQWGIFVAGFLVPVALLLIYYRQFWTWSQIYHSSVNPLQIVTENLTKLFSAIAAPSAPAENDFGLGLQSGKTSWMFLKETINLNLFLFIVPFGLVSLLGVSKLRSKEESGGILLLLIWVAALSIFYGYHYFYRGFFPQYLREFFVPLLIGFALLLDKIVLTNSASAGQFRSLMVVLVGAAAVYVSYRYQVQFRSYHRAGLFLLAMVVVFFLLQNRQMVFSDFRWARFGSLLAATALIGSLWTSMAFCAWKLGPGYLGLWTPAEVSKVKQYILEHSETEDSVLAGSPLWAIESGRGIVPKLSHPLILKEGVSPEQEKNFFELMTKHPPQLIVEDQYTREIYCDLFPWFPEIQKTMFMPVGTVLTRSGGDIIIYRRSGSIEPTTNRESGGGQ